MRQRIYILALLVLLLIGLFYWIGNSSTTPRFDWSESDSGGKAYNEANEQPYGSRVFFNLLRNYFPGEPLFEINGSLVKNLPLRPNATIVKGTYLFIGEGLYLDSADTQHLLHFVQAGNTALIISKTIPFDLMNYIYYEECGADGRGIWDDYEHSSSSTERGIRLLSPDSVAEARVYFSRQNQTSNYTWSFIQPYVFCPEQSQYPLGYYSDDSTVNFAAFPSGAGRFLAHSTPLAFSNFHLLRPEVQQYAAGVLSHLPKGPIWWDAFSRVPEAVTRRRNNSRDDGGLPEEHALSFVLQKESLAWAWYILLVLAFLYLVFRTLRKQRPIPVLPKNENSSFEFISTIANLHFRERNYKGISVQAMKLFVAQIREKYGLVATIDPNTQLITISDIHFYKKLSKRSGVSEQDIKDLFDRYEVIARFEPNEQHLIDFYLSMEHFWKKA